MKSITIFEVKTFTFCKKDAEAFASDLRVDDECDQTRY